MKQSFKTVEILPYQSSHSMIEKLHRLMCLVHATFSYDQVIFDGNHQYFSLYQVFRKTLLAVVYCIALKKNIKDVTYHKQLFCNVTINARFD